MLAPWKKSCDKPRQHIKRQRHYFANKGPSIQSMVFPGVMYGYESCNIKKAKHQRTNAFEQWCLRTLLRVPWAARRSNQWILKEISSVQSLSCVRLFATPWTATRQASLSLTDSWSLLKLMSIESMMPSNHLILCHPLLLLPSILPSIRVFSNESALCIRRPEYWSFSFSISPSNEYSGLIFFRIYWFDLLAAQGTLNSLF